MKRGSRPIAWVEAARKNFERFPKAAGMTGFAAADFSHVRSADLGRFTLDRLIKMLGSLDDSIEVTIRLTPRPAGQEVGIPGPETEDDHG